VEFGHFPPMDSGERGFERPEQIEAGIPASSLHSHVGGNRPNFAQLLGRVDARSHQHLRGLRAEIQKVYQVEFVLRLTSGRGTPLGALLHLHRTLQLFSNGLLLFGRHDGEISLKENLLGIAFCVARNHMRMQVWNMLTRFDAVILKHVRANRPECTVRGAGELLGQLSNCCKLRIRCVENRFNVSPWYDERRAALVLPKVDERDRQFIFNDHSIESFSSDIATEAAFVVLVQSKGHAKILSWPHEARQAYI